MNFLTLSTQVSQPFVIPNVSPISSPKLDALSLPSTSSNIAGFTFHPLIPHDNSVELSDESLLNDRKVSIIELNN